MPSEFGWDLAIGDVRGTRAWRLLADGWGTQRLTGINHPQFWYPTGVGENRAECRRGNGDRCTGVEPRCSCGFYAYLRGINDYLAEYERGYGSPPMATTATYASATYGTDLIGGAIRGWGKTVVGTRGFRTERAEILALYVPSMSWQVAGHEVEYSFTGFQAVHEFRELRPVPVEVVTTLRQRLEDTYHVPVFTDWKELLHEFPPTEPEIVKGD